MKKRLSYILLVCVFALTASGQAQDSCPPCYYNNRVLPGHGYTSDGLLKLNIYVEPQGWSSTDIEAKVRDAVTCANNMWNRARGVNINDRIPYSLEVTTDTTKVDIVVQRGLSFDGCGQNTPSGSQDIIDVDSAAERLNPTELCEFLAHEYGHSLGLANEESNCFTIMNGSMDDGSCRANELSRAVQAPDVDRVIQNFFEADTCTEDAAAEENRQCRDFDGDGMSTCDGDCDDNDPSYTYQCYYVDPEPYYPNYCCQPTCYYYYDEQVSYTCVSGDDGWECSQAEVEYVLVDHFCY